MFCVMDLYYKIAIFELELRKYISYTRFLLQNCEFRAGGMEVYDLYYKVVIFESELRKCISRVRFILKCYDFRVGLTKVSFVYETCILKLRFSSCGSVFYILNLYYKVALFELELRKCILNTRFVI